MNHKIFNILLGIAALLPTKTCAAPPTGSPLQADHFPLRSKEPVKYLFLCLTDGSEVVFPLADNPVMEVAEEELIVESTADRLSTSLQNVSRFYFLENKISTGIQNNQMDRAVQATSISNGHIRLSGLPAGVQVRLYATNGRCVAEKTIPNSGDTDIDLTFYPKGVYILHLPAGQLKVMNR
ncbi:MAG: T9SS type A sorting domain-containing protein [Prevotella sp.]|nr:T9SS type A sorting domain-containing protein [Prevotella sp.]